MAIVELTKENFEDVISTNDIVLVDFWATWCGPCQSFAPIYEAAAEKYPEIVFAKVDTEQEQELGASFQIRSIPTLMIFREQIILFSEAGALQASALDEVLEKARALDMQEVHADIERQKAEQAQAQSQS